VSSLLDARTWVVPVRISGFIFEKKFKKLLKKVDTQKNNLYSLDK